MATREPHLGDQRIGRSADAPALTPEERLAKIRSAGGEKEKGAPAWRSDRVLLRQLLIRGPSG